MQNLQASPSVKHPAFGGKKLAAFTLVELLVVIGIIAVLIGILLPTLAKARQQALVTVCMSNERQLVIALLMYCADNKGGFPGGPGTFKVNGVLQPPTPRLASWDTESRNPYSCNQDENNGPIWLAKYVGNSVKIPGCPAEPLVQQKGYANTAKRTNYWYPMSLVYKPEEIFDSATFIDAHDSMAIGTPQTPQKITHVRHPANKCVIIESATYHDKVILKIDDLPPGANALTYRYGRVVVAGFADSHVERRLVSDMYDRDVNNTGRGTDEPGVLGKDFK